MKYENFIHGCLENASEIALRHFTKVQTLEKGTDNNQVLTMADIEIGHRIVELIQTKFPDHNIIDEEAGIIDNGSSYTWVVDPIDGTSNYASGLPMYGTMIGLLEGNTPIAGGIILPAFDEVYYAEKGCGAYCNGARIQVTESTNLLKCLAVYAIDGQQEHPDATREECRLLADFVLAIRNLRTSGSCYDMMMVARGKYAAWLCRSSKIWDNVAPQVIIEEAGGIYTDFVGKPIDYTNPLSLCEKNFTNCVASPLFHQQVQGIIAGHNFIN